MVSCLRSHKCRYIYKLALRCLSFKSPIIKCYHSRWNKSVFDLFQYLIPYFLLSLFMIHNINIYLYFFHSYLYVGGICAILSAAVLYNYMCAWFMFHIHYISLIHVFNAYVLFPQCVYGSTHSICMSVRFVSSICVTHMLFVYYLPRRYVYMSSIHIYYFP